MKGSSFGYLVRQGITNTWLNRMMSAASIGILTACLIIVGGAGLLAVNVRDLFTAIESQNEVVVFLQDDITVQQKADLEQEFRETGHVADYRYVSKADALEEQKGYMGDQGYLLEGLEEDNPLPASFRITLDGLENLGTVVERITGVPGVDSVSAPTDLADTLEGLEKTFLIVGSIIIGILVVASAVVISNTIRLTLFARRREINIMKYVGATNRFIRLPFVVEGMAIGVFSALFAFGVIWAIYQSLGELLTSSAISWLTGFGKATVIPFSSLWYWVLGGFLIVGVLIGAIGSSSSMRRYLEV